MRHNRDYEFAGDADVRSFVRSYPWATMVSATSGGLVASHYPFLLDESAEGLVLLSHVGKPDEELHGLGSGQLLVVFYGPSGYISPSWYDSSPAVPTWNYQAVHMSGSVEILTPGENLEVLDRLVHHFEDVLPHPYLLKRDPENVAYAERIMGGTVGFRMHVETWAGKSKLSQDKPEHVRRRIIDNLKKTGPYTNPRLATVMQSNLGER